MRDKIKEFIDRYDIKEKAKKTGKVIMVATPVASLLAVGYFGLKTSKDPDYKDWIGDD